MAQQTVWQDWQVVGTYPEIRSNCICQYERHGTNLSITVITQNHCTFYGAWRHNRWAMDVSVNGQLIAENVQIKPRTSGYINTSVYQASASATINIGNAESALITISYYDTGWSTAKRVYTWFNTLQAWLTGIPSFPSCSLGANYSYPNLTHNSINVNYSVSGSYDWLRVYVDGRLWADGVRNNPFTVTGLAPDTNHSIYAHAYGSGGFGNASNTLTFRTYVTPVKVGKAWLDNVEPFTCTGLCTSDNASNTQQYEFAICDTSPSRNVKRGAYTTKNGYYNFDGLEEETEYYLRVRVQTRGSGAWSDYVYILFKTPADIVRSYFQLPDGSVARCKTWFKNPDDSKWYKAKKAWLNINGKMVQTKNKYD